MGRPKIKQFKEFPASTKVLILQLFVRITSSGGGKVNHEDPSGFSSNEWKPILLIPEIKTKTYMEKER